MTRQLDEKEEENDQTSKDRNEVLLPLYLSIPANNEFLMFELPSSLAAEWSKLPGLEIRGERPTLLTNNQTFQLKKAETSNLLCLGVCFLIYTKLFLRKTLSLSYGQERERESH
jgi:hypothetical protein